RKRAYIYSIAPPSRRRVSATRVSPHAAQQRGAGVQPTLWRVAWTWLDSLDTVPCPQSSPWLAPLLAGLSAAGSAPAQSPALRQRRLQHRTRLHELGAPHPEAACWYHIGLRLD